jgi:hypothetical protein
MHVYISKRTVQYKYVFYYIFSFELCMTYSRINVSSFTILNFDNGVLFLLG